VSTSHLLVIDLQYVLHVIAMVSSVWVWNLVADIEGGT